MFMVKFSLTALNFGYDFVLFVHLFWDTLYVRSFPLLLQTRYIFHLKELFPVVATGPTTARTVLWFDKFFNHNFENNILHSFAVKYFLIQKNTKLNRAMENSGAMVIACGGW